MVTLEKRTISYLSVSARIRMIDPFSQIKREYNTISDDADSANRNNFSHHDAFLETVVLQSSQLRTAVARRLKQALGAH